MSTPKTLDAFMRHRKAALFQGFKPLTLARFTQIVRSLNQAS